MIRPLTAMSASAAWRDVLQLCLAYGEPVSPRGIPCREVLGVTTIVDMTRPCVFSRLRKVSPQFACGETLWYADGRNDLATILRHAPSYWRYSDDGETLFGAYGPKIMSQLESVLDALRADPLTRQAVWNIWRENPPASKDIPCSLSTQFLIRNGKLHCIHTMRSNDAWIGFIYDVFAFSMLSAIVALLLRARGCYVELGELHLTVGSQHLYDRNIDTATEVLALGSDDNPPEMLMSNFNLSDYASRAGLIADLELVSTGLPPVRPWLQQWRDYHHVG